MMATTITTSSSTSSCISSRTSFQQSLQTGESPPKKCRRNCSGEASSVPGSRSYLTVSKSAPYFVTTPLGFSTNEFLPLNYNTPRPRAVSIDANKLSDDVLGMCLCSGFLDSVETARLVRVSKRIRRIASQQVQRLDLSRCNKLTIKDIAAIVKNFENLMELDFSYCSQFGAEDLNQLIPLAKSTLQHLNLKGTKVVDKALVNFLQTVGPCQLQSIDVSAITKEGSVRIGDTTARAIATYCPNLKSLRLAWCSTLTEQGVGCLAELSDLIELDLSLTGISSSQSCNHLLKLLNNNLQVLDLSATQLTLEGLEKLFSTSSSAPKLRLQELTLRFLDELTPALLERAVQQAGTTLRFVDVSHSGSEGSLAIPSALASDIRQRGIQVKGMAVHSLNKRI